MGLQQRAAGALHERWLEPCAVQFVQTWPVYLQSPNAAALLRCLRPPHPQRLPYTSHAHERCTMRFLSTMVSSSMHGQTEKQEEGAPVANSIDNQLNQLEPAAGCTRIASFSSSDCSPASTHTVNRCGAPSSVGVGVVGIPSITPVSLSKCKPSGRSGCTMKPRVANPP